MSPVDIDVSKMSYVDYQAIAHQVILRCDSAGTAHFECSGDENIVREILGAEVTQKTEQVRVLIARSDRPSMSPERFVSGYIAHHLALWLKCMALSKMPIVVSEINGRHIIAAIRGKGCPDVEIDTTDFVLSNYLHEIAVTLRECDPSTI